MLQRCFSVKLQKCFVDFETKVSLNEADDPKTKHTKSIKGEQQRQAEKSPENKGSQNVDNKTESVKLTWTEER